MLHKRNDDGTIGVTLTPEEAHVIVWGGPQDVVDLIDRQLQRGLVNIEDNVMSDGEYAERFDDLDAMYMRLRMEGAMQDA